MSQSGQRVSHPFPPPPTEWVTRISNVVCWDEKVDFDLPPPPPLERQVLQTQTKLIIPETAVKQITPVQIKPITVTPTKVVPTQVRPKPGSARPIQAVQAQVKPVSARPVSARPPLNNPAQVKPVSARPAPIKPALVKPAPVKPTLVKPALVKPAPVKPAPVKPVPVKPTLVKPAPVKPTLVKQEHKSGSARPVRSIPTNKVPTNKVQTRQFPPAKLPHRIPHPLEKYDLDTKRTVFTLISEFAGTKTVLAIRACCKTFRDSIKVVIQLKSHQTDHISRLENIIQREQSYFDTSPKGAGKTFHSLYIAKKYDLKLMVVCENNTQVMWEMLAKIYDVEFIQAISYNSLRGTCKSDLNHAWLTREGDKFYVTQDFKDEVESGVLLVFDEVQKMRNDTAQFHAGLTLAKYIYNPETLNPNECINSRVALVSATPCNTDAGGVNMLKLLGIITEDKLVRYNRSRKIWEPEGLFEVYQKACEYDMELADEIYQNGALHSKKHAEEVCAELYSLILLNNIGSSTPEFDLAAEKDCSNAFFKVGDDTLEGLQDNMEKLKESLVYNKDTQEYEYTKTTQGLLFKILPEIEAGKADVFVEETIRILTENENAKVLLFINYHKGIDKVLEGLNGWPAAAITGHVPPARRLVLIKQFQEHNSNLRVLITNTQVCGTGVSLDDTNGAFPRFCLLSPSYNFINIDQATGRTWRANTKSNVSITLVYIQGLEEEQAILNSLAKKSDKARSFIYDSSKTVFPGEYRVRLVG